MAITPTWASPYDFFAGQLVTAADMNTYVSNPLLYLYRKGGQAGTAFPGSPTAGDRFWRTDLGFDCYYDGARWLSSHEYTAEFQPWEASPPYGATVNALISPAHSDYPSIYITRAWWLAYVFVVNNVSNYWVVNMQRDGGNVWSVSSASYAANSVIAVSTALNMVNNPSSFFMWNLAKFGSPGNMQFSGTFRYRLVLT